MANVLTSDKRKKKGKERKERKKWGGAYETKGDTLTAP